MKISNLFVLVASLVLVGCVPTAPPQQQTAGSMGSEGYAGGGGGGGDSAGVCEAYCARQAECGMADYQPCVGGCQQSFGQPGYADAAADLADDSCEELQMKAQNLQQGGGGGGGAPTVGGDGSGCRRSGMTGGPAIQDCPWMQECCNGGCHSTGYCGMPTGR